MVVSGELGQLFKETHPERDFSDFWLEVSLNFLINSFDLSSFFLLCEDFTPTAMASSSQSFVKTKCRMDLPGPTTLVGTRTDYSVGPWDYPACATRHLMAWSTRTTEEKYLVRKLYMSCTVRKTPRRTRLVLSPYSDL
jgi:hypothetical protein